MSVDADVEYWRRPWRLWEVALTWCNALTENHMQEVLVGPAKNRVASVVWKG